MRFAPKTLHCAVALAWTTVGVGVALMPVRLAMAADLKIDVTGTNIKRTEGEGALPVQTITARQIQEGGIQNTSELLQTISANQSFGSFNPAGGEGSNLVGFTGASLRGLGSQRTLVLLNGRRVAPYALSDAAGAGSVDLTAIPVSAIERVEILKDGASAIYGSDAIAGVINFILRKDYSGADVGFTYLDTQDGGGADRRVWGTAGFGDLTKDKYNLLLIGEYDSQLGLRAVDRAFSRTSYIPSLGTNLTSGNTVPANITIPGVQGTRNPGFPMCLPPTSFSTAPQSPGQCRFDYAQTIDTVPPADKGTIIGRFAWQIDPQTQLFVEGSYFHGDYTQRISPTPVSSSYTLTPVVVNPGTPFYPAAYVASQGGDPALPVDLSYRAIEFGARTDEAISEQYRAVVGLEGTRGGWDYSLAFNYTGNDTTDNYTDGYLSSARFVPLLANGTINPFGLNTPAAIAAGNATKILGRASDNKASDIGVQGKVSRDAFTLPAGPVALALGLEWRQEALELKNADFLVSGDIIGGLGAIPSLPRTTNNVFSAFGEVNLPIVSSLEANVALRYDDYQDFGSTWNPKVSLRWQPARNLLLRGSYGTGFRAPSLFDLFQPTYRTVTSNNFSDPARCPQTQSVFDCQLQFNSQRGGNANLQPERSQQANAGIVWDSPEFKLGDTSLGTLSLGADYYWIKIKNAITFLSAATVFGNYNLYAPDFIVRGPPTPDYPALPGPILYVRELRLNFAEQLVDGVDVDATWRLPSAWGNFSATFTGTYLNHFRQTQFDGSDPNFAGTSGSPNGAISRWRHYLTLNWTAGAWGATINQTFQNGYTESFPNDFTGQPVTRRVGAYSLWNLQARYSGIKDTTLALGMKNVFNRAPPVSGSVSTFQFGYDASYADPRGLQYYGTISIGFH
jgi:iron complex outermembrane receptor protein